MRRPTGLFFSVIASVAICTTAVSGQDVGIGVGKKAPEFSLEDQHGKVVKSTELLKKGPLAIVFHRSANW